ncbi:Ohr family peroxiredoxin [Taklimakanibacter albus]|uniref:Ohr family peroxiredoxin n=1 Tax=Taklimakanibacter albus TaxID=2800327 RepID=A0ACC5R082_9HYPH|nr:Ohr family peroxiredoxin [Aestuariivirga sp. YIM B02566]MBK1865838.1 Ohr family peroxiredoxin [Aestuariivirga sp. YIM B02566]
MTEKLYFAGKTHTIGGHNGASKSVDGSLDIQLPEPHPAAENHFAAAWSACYLGAIELAAGQRKIKLASAPEVDAEIKLFHDGPKGFFLRARFDVSIAGVDKETVRELADAAHNICPYSKATHGNIDVETHVA